MKLYTTMPPALKPYYQDELLMAHFELSQNNLQQCWHHYERAHILGQQYPLQHSFVHWQMLIFGLKIKSIKEIYGQVAGLIFGGIKSFVGRVPVGNTGGANVPALQPMEIPEDLQIIINQNK